MANVSFTDHDIQAVSNAQKARILRDALPYIKEYNGKVVVVKYGGNAMINEDLKKAVLADIVLLNLIGVKVVFVHGGGPHIKEVLAEIGVESKFINGLRVTDEKTMKVVQMVLAGQVNKDLVNLLGDLGGKAIGLCGIDGQMIQVEQQDKELGLVAKLPKSIRPLSKTAWPMAIFPSFPRLALMATASPTISMLIRRQQKLPGRSRQNV